MLIADGDSPISLTILRSLGQRNVQTTLMASFGLYASRFSRYYRNQVLVPSTSLRNEYARAVEKLVRKGKFDVLFPILEWSLIPISENRDRIGSYVKLPIASHESILKCFDKLSTMKLAIQLGVPTPKTYSVRGSAELKKISQEMTYPCVVKPRWSIIWQSDRAFDRRGGFVNSPAELASTYKSIHKYFPYPLIQEYIPGTNYSVAAMYNQGKPRAYCCIKVQRAWPTTGGNSCFRESVPLNPKMKTYSETLLKALDWHGIAEVEYRLDSRDKTPKLMEINPRFWGSLCVAVKAGLDFPYMLYQMAMDGDTKSTFSYKAGVKGRYFEQDCLYIASTFRDALTSSSIWSQNSLTLLASWLKFYEPGLFYDLLDVNDPLPFLFSSAMLPLQLVKFLKQQNYAWGPPRVSS